MKEINNKRPYMKPSMKVFTIDARHQILAGSPLPIDPTPTPNQW